MVYCITNAPLKLQMQFHQRCYLTITAPSSDITQHFIPVIYYF